MLRSARRARLEASFETLAALAPQGEDREKGTLMLPHKQVK